MSVLIPNITEKDFRDMMFDYREKTLREDGTYVVIAKDGRWIDIPNPIEVETPHGRLIDENELKDLFKYTEDAEYARWTLAGVLMEIDDTDTVIEAEE